MDNGEDYTKPTVFGRSAFESAQAVDRAARARGLGRDGADRQAVRVRRGADIEEFPKIRTREEAIEGSRAGHELFGRIRALPYPTVAAINGACLGGGVEIALHCSARTISTRCATSRLPGGLPRDLPGLGRHAARPAPRRRGDRDPLHRHEPAAAEQDARRARRRSSSASPTGCSSPVEFVDESIAFALELVESPLERAEPDHGDIDKALRKGRSQADDAVHGAAPRAVRRARPDRARVQGRVARGRLPSRGGGDRRPDARAATRRSLYAYDVVERRAKKGIGIPTPRRASSRRSASSARA